VNAPQPFSEFEALEWLTQHGATQHLKKGDRFEVIRGTPHGEKYGPQGATDWVARTM